MKEFTEIDIFGDGEKWLVPNECRFLLLNDSTSNTCRITEVIAYVKEDITFTFEELEQIAYKLSLKRDLINEEYYVFDIKEGTFGGVFCCGERLKHY